LVETGDLDAALADYERAIEINPASGHTYAAWVLVRLKLADEARAQADIQKAKALNPALMATADLNVAPGLQRHLSQAPK
jgi:tetratricopeptide (TPR) repeat protein